ncbi:MULTISPECIES: signal peptidase I [unclassified Pseudoalteromonas]|uniref:signal peptidase I n=1 Tax=unclassified Pseudoalteromonas TaxID=194690 RepID=UPI001603D687|nr:signal peptidase I [Pseudoalteromonas sp. SR41-4]MBB1291993.1 signal peptidase I [Pseudoalteromonas sp. SR41-4]
MKYLYKIWKNNRSLIVFISLMCVFRSAVADWYEVPTGSMQPTIVEGDRILTDKMAYDLRVPFTKISLVKLAEPQAGDIIVFDSVAAQNRLIKRVIGVPGDTVALVNNQLVINGEKLDYETVAETAINRVEIENLHGIKHTVKLAKQRSYMQNFDPLIIPTDMYLAMGDNRDNSADSRVIGLVPRAELLGRAKRVIVSLDYDDYYLPRKNRLLKELQ